MGNGTYGIKSNLPVDLSNCIIWGNSNQLNGNCSAIYSCIQGGAAGEGNISANPLFAYDDPNDYHLGPDSPCRDIGHDPNGDGSYYDNLDIDGNVRVYNGRVDMGADEYTCDDIYNDVDWNVDRIVDTADLMILAEAWLSDDTPTSNWNPDCDIQPENGDGDVDYGDFAVFAAEWLWQPCWTSSGPSAPMMMGMGGGESMLMAETEFFAPAATLQESSAIPTEPSVSEQIEMVKRCLEFWYREDVREGIEDEDAWLRMVTSLEEMLKDLEDSQ